MPFSTTGMKRTKWIMGMPITVVVLDEAADEDALQEVFEYFAYVDQTFSTYKVDSEISKINRKEIEKKYWGEDMKTVFDLADKTKKETGGYFDIVTPEKTFDPSGLVKGWAIYNAAEILAKKGYKNFYVNAGGDIEARGKNKDGKNWSVGIRNPFANDRNNIVKTVFISDRGLATSGTYERGQHIYNPRTGRAPLLDISSITVIGPNVFEADRFATAAFAMGKDGINFIEQLSGFEGYTIDANGIATMTSGFEKYC